MFPVRGAACRIVGRVGSCTINQCSRGTRDSKNVWCRTLSSSSSGPNMSLFWNKPREFRVGQKRVLTMSLSEAAGHASFVWLGLMYSEADVLHLRLYAAAGISCSIIFQYFRPQPLWIPISWNVAFLGINAAMVAFLIKENEDSHRLGEEKETLYRKVFQQAGLTSVDYMKLMAIATSIDVPEGEYLAREGVVQDKLYVVTKGQLSVQKRDEDIGLIDKGDFAGDMSFVTHMRSDCTETEDCNCKAMANVKVLTQGTTLYMWHFDELREMLSVHPEMSQGFLSALLHAMMEKLVSSHSPQLKYHQLLQGVVVDGVVTEGEKEKLQLLRETLGVDNATHLKELRGVGWSKEEYEQGYQNQKNCTEYENLMRQALRLGRVSHEDREALRAHRVANNLDDIQHLGILHKVGWDLNAYEAGTNGSGG